MSRLPHQHYPAWQPSSSSSSTSSHGRERELQSTYSSQATYSNVPQAPPSSSRAGPSTWTNGATTSTASLPSTYTNAHPVSQPVTKLEDNRPVPIATAQVLANGTTIYAATGRKRKRLQKDGDEPGGLDG
ncbi:hypothetical protein IE53DRAFT_371939 [Violaceomyces palustris]|uniref:Uncharacterized protein n=1 Tax=Violaceomyces palustris TaxID=1673888 RepID=A0ACD0NM78_9BASI|nr:hypothetical protein IE53DRAFT_371939 [Violaceomyces palustris]